MCLIVAKKGHIKTPIPAQYINNAGSNNPHGFGIAGRDPNQPKMRTFVNRTMDMERAEFYIRQYEELGWDFIAHWRYATHGEKDLENCHPFAFADETYIAHNGVLNITRPMKQFSDTWHWAYSMSAYAANGQLGITRKGIRKFFYQIPVNRGITRTSKFAVIGPNVPLMVINPKLWKKEDDIWYSNEDTLKHGRIKVTRKLVGDGWQENGSHPEALRTNGEYKNDAELLRLNRGLGWLSNDIELGVASAFALTGIARTDFMEYWKRFPMEIAECFANDALRTVREQEEAAKVEVEALEKAQPDINPATGTHNPTCPCVTCEYAEQQRRLPVNPTVSATAIVVGARNVTLIKEASGTQDIDLGDELYAMTWIKKATPIPFTPPQSLLELEEEVCH